MSSWRRLYPLISPFSSTRLFSRVYVCACYCSFDTCVCHSEPLFGNVLLYNWPPHGMLECKTIPEQPTVTCRMHICEWVRPYYIWQKRYVYSMGYTHRIYIRFYYVRFGCGFVVTVINDKCYLSNHGLHVHIKMTPTYILSILPYPETKMLSIWRNFRHWLSQVVKMTRQILPRARVSQNRSGPNGDCKNKVKTIYMLIQGAHRKTVNSWCFSLTQWGRETHICVGKLTTIASDNGLSPSRRQAIIWINAGILLIRPLGTNFSEILIEIHTFSFKKIKDVVCERATICLGLNELI